MIERFVRRWRHDGPRACVAILLGAAGLLCTHGAWAKNATVAVYAEGADAAAVRDMVVAALPSGATAFDASAFSEALSDQGQNGPFGKKLDGAAHAAAVKRVRAAAAAHGVDAVVIVRVTRDKSKQRRVRMFLVDATGSETPIDDVRVALKDDAHDRAEIASAVGPALEKYGSSSPAPAAAASNASAPAPSASAGDAPSGDANSPPGSDASNPDTVSHRPHGTLARSLFDVEVGADAAGRNFVYSDPITNNLRTYSVAPAAMASASGEVFPFADGRAGLLRDVGVMAGYAQSLGLQSTAEGAKIPTNWNSYYAGARVRIHPGGDNGPIIGISDSYSALAFTFGSAGASIADQIPSVNYQANRAAVDARIPIGGMAILASAGFRVVFDAGDVASRFRQPSVNGVDGELGVAVGIVSGWEARLVGDYQRYFYSFTPVPGNAYVAGGALDQFFGGRLAVAYIF